MKKQTLSAFTESAIMIALATVLSFVKLLDLPYGGSITVGSMFPMIALSYRHGLKVGLLGGVTFSVIQLLTGLGTLSYATSWQSAVAIIMLDYIIAFSVTSLAVVGRYIFKNNQTAGLISGGVIVCVLRYICHTISGCTVWAGVSVPDTQGLIYSLSYNATYMIPETVVLIAILWYVSRIIDLRHENLRTVTKRETAKKGAITTTALGWIAVLSAVVYDTVAVFSVLQNADTGELDFSQIASAPWINIAVVSAVCIVICAILLIIGAKIKVKSKKTV
ncbi:MAG: energy-coupled thiamine transporter ThiT [Acutalibacteraceae bacterium]|nr:energy-coupled thiamine transporter ThiT [Clostridia bacterium]MEE1144459.1 energy-coupled thiamine transporter ThiT [Acutalibacteraceae bacterium]